MIQVKPCIGDTYIMYNLMYPRYKVWGKLVAIIPANRRLTEREVRKYISNYDFKNEEKPYRRYILERLEKRQDPTSYSIFQDMPELIIIPASEEDTFYTEKELQRQIVQEVTIQLENGCPTIKEKKMKSCTKKAKAAIYIAARESLSIKDIKEFLEEVNKDSEEKFKLKLKVKDKDRADILFWLKSEEQEIPVLINDYLVYEHGNGFTTHSPSSMNILYNVS